MEALDGHAIPRLHVSVPIAACWPLYTLVPSAGRGGLL